MNCKLKGGKLIIIREYLIDILKKVYIPGEGRVRGGEGPGRGRGNEVYKN